MITKDNNLKGMEIFFKNPGKSFHIRELARITGLSTTEITKIIKRLKKKGLLISKKEKITEEVKPNFEDNFYLIKKLYNFYSLYKNGLINHLKNFYEELQAIILFGSYSKGLDTEKSDINLCVLTTKKETPNLINFEKNQIEK